MASNGGIWWESCFNRFNHHLPFIDIQWHYEQCIREITKVKIENLLCIVRPSTIDDICIRKSSKYLLRILYFAMLIVEERDLSSHLQRIAELFQQGFHPFQEICQDSFKICPYLWPKITLPPQWDCNKRGVSYSSTLCHKETFCIFNSSKRKKNLHHVA